MGRCVYKALYKSIRGFVPRLMRWTLYESVGRDILWDVDRAAALTLCQVMDWAIAGNTHDPDLDAFLDEVLPTLTSGQG